ncbi:MAG: tryptophan 2,3-dioxygenase family protein [Candidatus Kapabacteria bacterium]|nr:tryptophan 2,3-dioxygenase family protein [Candidatus Kapabacteria bacterium]
MSDKLSYWDYVGVDTLLNLQKPKTDFEDEHIFIIYHQISELFFRLIINELKLLTDDNKKEFLDYRNWIKRLGRVINNFNILTNSISILMPEFSVFSKAHQILNDSEISTISVSCFDNQQFLKFRQALVPASGFQSFQYRTIEIMSTQLQNLVHPSKKDDLKNENDIENIYQNLYWKYGARIVKDDNLSNPDLLEKAETLIEFENKYDSYFLDLAKEYENKNLLSLYQKYITDINSENSKKVRDVLKYYDTIVNRHYKGVHYGLAYAHLKDTTGTGGTNWHQYLSISKNEISFFE